MALIRPGPDDGLELPMVFTFTQSAEPPLEFTPVSQTAPILAGGPDELCTEIISEAPPQYSNVFALEEETPQSVALVEQALSRAQISQADGFRLEYKGFSCCPRLSVYPTLDYLPEGWEISSTEDCHCCCCFFPPIPLRERKRQTMILKHNDQVVLYFKYSPKICCCGGRTAQDRMVDVFIPERHRDHRIACIVTGNRYKDATLVVDCVTDSLFGVRRVKIEEMGDAIAVSVNDRHGIPVALAQSTRGWKTQGWLTWNEFELKFCSDILGSLSGSSKVVVMVAFVMWTITYREDISISKLRWCIFGIAVTIIILLCPYIYGMFTA